VLALVHGDMGLFDEAFVRLTSIVKGPSRDSAKIHAMHSIRVMLLDARHSHLFKRYFQISIIISLDAYETEKSVSACTIPFDKILMTVSFQLERQECCTPPICQPNQSCHRKISQ
jgi:hypothetical protein